MNLGVIASIWVLMILLVNPVGDFPLNDDWAYGWSVKVLLETGDFQLSDWTAVNLLPQVIWGALFSLPLGFSFTALRLSTLALGLVGVFTTYAVLREVRASPAVSLVGALAVALNPIYFVLSNSFMSDVPSYALMTGAVYFLLRAVRRDTTRDVLAGAVLASLALLNRQSGLVLLPAFAAAYVTRYGLGGRRLLWAVVPGVVGSLAYLSYGQWLEASGRAPHLYDFQTTLLLHSLAGGVAGVATTLGRNLVVMATYLGLFVLPAVVLAVPGAGSLAHEAPRIRRSVLVGFAVVVPVAIAAAMYVRLPSVGNVLEVWGVGPSTISRGQMRQSTALLIHRGWQLLTMLGIVGTATVLGAAVAALRPVFGGRADRQQLATATFAVALAVLYVLPISLLRPEYWFDRYLLPLMPPAMVLLAVSSGGDRPQGSRWRAPIAAVLVASYGLFSILATHDYLVWHRARWQAVEAVRAGEGVSPQRIDAGGGREFRGWHLGHRVSACNVGLRGGATAEARSWADFTCLRRTGDEPYIVSLAVRDGYDVVREHRLGTWLPMQARRFYLLRRHEGERDPASTTSRESTSWSEVSTAAGSR